MVFAEESFEIFVGRSYIIHGFIPSMDWNRRNFWNGFQWLQ